MKNNNNKIYLVGGLFLVLGFLIGFLVFTETSNVGDARRTIDPSDKESEIEKIILEQLKLINLTDNEDDFRNLNLYQIINEQLKPINLPHNAEIRGFYETEDGIALQIEYFDSDTRFWGWLNVAWKLGKPKLDIFGGGGNNCCCGCPDENCHYVNGQYLCAA